MFTYSFLRGLRILRIATRRLPKAGRLEKYALWAQITKATVVSFPYRDGPEYEARALNYMGSLMAFDSALRRNALKNLEAFRDHSDKGPDEPKLPYTIPPKGIARSAPDEYGVVCYRNAGSSQNLSCVQVVSPKANTP